MGVYHNNTCLRAFASQSSCLFLLPLRQAGGRGQPSSWQDSAGLCTGTSAILLLDPPEIPMERSALRPLFFPTSHLSGFHLPRNFASPPPLFLSETPSTFSTRHGWLPGAEFQANPSPTPGYSSYFLPLQLLFPSLLPQGLLCSPHIAVRTYYVPDREYNSNMTRPLPLHYKS